MQNFFRTLFIKAFRRRCARFWTSEPAGPGAGSERRREGTGHAGVAQHTKSWGDCLTCLGDAAASMAHLHSNDPISSLVDEAQ